MEAIKPIMVAELTAEAPLIECTTSRTTDSVEKAPSVTVTSLGGRSYIQAMIVGTASRTVTDELCAKGSEKPMTTTTTTTTTGSEETSSEVNEKLAPEEEEDEEEMGDEVVENIIEADDTQQQQEDDDEIATKTTNTDTNTEMSECSATSSALDLHAKDMVDLTIEKVVSDLSELAALEDVEDALNTTTDL